MDQIMTHVHLTDEQEYAVTELSKCRAQVQTMGGYGGTGKTTVIHELREHLPRFAVCAFTGKATQVLRRKGVPDASTIHSLIYKPIDDGYGKVTFELKTELSTFDGAVYDGVIVDEASMVSEPLHNDLMSFDVPLIYIGDHGQLPPVGTGNFNLMTNPDITLEKIHRNAGEIAYFAEHLRKGNDAKDWKSGDKVKIMDVQTFADSGAIQSVDQMICAYNKTRVALNSDVREVLGIDSELPQVGDRVMCLQNSREHALFNGMQGTIERIDHQRAKMIFASGDLRIPVFYNRMAFGAEKTPDRESGRIPFDWCYCVTCHKAQGDEWDHVIVIEQRCRAWEHARWAYTAASRAKNRLTWVLE